jgi:hypothetical protein
MVVAGLDSVIKGLAISKSVGVRKCMRNWRCGFSSRLFWPHVACG